MHSSGNALLPSLFDHDIILHSHNTHRWSVIRVHQSKPISTCLKFIHTHKFFQCFKIQLSLRCVWLKSTSRTNRMSTVVVLIFKMYRLIYKVILISNKLELFHPKSCRQCLSVTSNSIIFSTDISLTGKDEETLLSELKYMNNHISPAYMLCLD